MAGLGVLFVVSAFESTDDETLAILDKNHSAADMSEAVAVLRSSGIHVRPTWLPFFPWTSPQDVAGIVDFIDSHRLWAATDPVQLAIRLLIPEGSLLETHPAVMPHLTGYRPESLTWSWEFEDPTTEQLHRELDSIAAQASDCGADAGETLQRMRETIGDIAEVDLSPMPSSPSVPRLTESWFCCAEPTDRQAATVGLAIGRVPLASA
jgi:hypothetical protein